MNWMRDGTRNMTKIETLHQRLSLSVHFFGTQRKSKTETNQIYHSNFSSKLFFLFSYSFSAPNRGRAHIKTNKNKNKI